MLWQLEVHQNLSYLVSNQSWKCVLKYLAFKLSNLDQWFKCYEKFMVCALLTDIDRYLAYKLSILDQWFKSYEKSHFLPY